MSDAYLGPSLEEMTAKAPHFLETAKARACQDSSDLVVDVICIVRRVTVIC